MTKSNHRKAGTAPITARTLAQMRLLPGFIYTAEVNATNFYPRSCMGGFKTLTGFPSSAFMRQDFYNDSVVARRDAGSLQEFRFAVKSTAVPKNIAYQLVTRQGKSINVSEQVTLIKDNGPHKLIGGIVTLSAQGAHSISLGSVEQDRLRLEEMEKLNKHLLEVNQLKDEFLANTSHELRTPLNSIIGFLTLITERYYESEDELRLFARNALDSSYHLLSVINDLLDISKIEAGKMQLQIERVYIDELIEEIYQLFKVQTDQKGLTLECTTRENPLFAAADIRKLKQVLINLIGNAVKFTSNGGVRISAGPRNGHLEFSIRDTGIGIPKEKHDRLFQKFIQLDGSATRRFGGSGLGLAISKHLIEMMGGRINIESKGAGMGTTVHFTIPKWTKEET